MSSCEPDCLFWGLSAKDLLVAGGWFFTILGWWVSNGQANSRECRKEARAEIDSCSELSEAILQLSRNYYGLSAGAPEEKSLAADIRFSLWRLFERVERLQAKHGAFDAIGATSELFDSVSGDDFETNKRKTYALDSAKLLKVESDIHHLIKTLEEGYGREFGANLKYESTVPFKQAKRKNKLGNAKATKK